jgi:hypothetical protein
MTWRRLLTVLLSYAANEEPPPENEMSDLKALLSLPAGRELDFAVAEHVFGWSPSWESEPPLYSVLIYRAWQVLGTLLTAGWLATIYSPGTPEQGWKVVLTNLEDVGYLPCCPGCQTRASHLGYCGARI